MQGLSESRRVTGLEAVTCLTCEEKHVSKKNIECPFEVLFPSSVLEVFMMNSVSAECQELKSTYDECFNKWFKEKYLKGSTRDPCSSIFKSYQECVKKAIKERGIELWDVEKDVLGTEREKQPPPKTGNTDSDKQSQKTKDSKKQ